MEWPPVHAAAPQRHRAAVRLHAWRSGGTDFMVNAAPRLLLHRRRIERRPWDGYRI